MTVGPEQVAVSAPDAMRAECARFRAQILEIRATLAQVVLGQAEVLDQLLVGVFAGGHVLLEGLPGLAKTLLVRALAKALGLTFRRVQFTPDLLPSDILGARTLVEGEGGGQRIEFQRGPVFTQILLADEINRSGPKTQSALLEAMQERQVTSGGHTYPLPRPFMVLATQNPIEQEGTYPLPEAQLDRFLLKLRIGLPAREDLLRVLDLDAGHALEEVPQIMDETSVLAAQRLARQVLVAEELRGRLADLILAAQPGAGGTGPAARLRLGLSPRAGQALVAAARVRALMLGRYHVTPADMAATLVPAMRHRLLLSFAAQADGTQADDLLHELAREHGLA